MSWFIILQELLKLRRKITSTVQVLTHLKEKLQFVQGQNHTEKSHLREVEEQVARVKFFNLMKYIEYLNMYNLFRFMNYSFFMNFI